MVPQPEVGLQSRFRGRVGCAESAVQEASVCERLDAWQDPMGDHGAEQSRDENRRKME